MSDRLMGWIVEWQFCDSSILESNREGWRIASVIWRNNESWTAIEVRVYYAWQSLLSNENQFRLRLGFLLFLRFRPVPPQTKDHQNQNHSRCFFRISSHLLKQNQPHHSQFTPNLLSHLQRLKKQSQNQLLSLV